MGFDVYGLQPKNLKYRDDNHPGEFDFSKFDFTTPEYKEYHEKSWDANATSGYYFRQSVGGFWGVIMSFADNVIEDLPKEVMSNEDYVINESDALKLSFYINEVMNEDNFQEDARKFITNRHNSRKESGMYGLLEDTSDELVEGKYNEFVNILSTFVNFAKNSGGFRIS